MKNILFYFVGLSLLFICKAGFCIEKADNQATAQAVTSSENSLNIQFSKGMQKLTTDLVDEYSKINPSVKINITHLNDRQSAQAENTLCLISDKNDALFTDKSNWKVAIGQDVIVPIINSKNPMIQEIYSQGISSNEFSILFSNPEKQNWEYLISGGKNSPVRYYIIENEGIKEAISNFTKSNPTFINVTLVKTGNDLISALEKDLYAIGFCKLTDIINPNTKEIAESIKLLPIDKNKNELIDNFENIYQNLNSFSRGVWIGKYPVELSNNVYALSAVNPTDKEALAFLAWITTDGQKFLNQNGFTDLTSVQKQSNLNLIIQPETSLSQSSEPLSTGIWMLIVIVFLVSGYIVKDYIRSIKIQKAKVIQENLSIKPLLNEHSILAPKGLYFDKTHTWAFMEKDGFIKVGIDDFIQHITGALTGVKLRLPGERIRRGEKILTINHEGKQLEIYSPVSGVIIEQNQGIITDSSQLNSSPYSEGWVYSIEPMNWTREIQFMFMAEKYKEWLRNEFARLRDFFAASVQLNTAVFTPIVLQDGGELFDNTLADLGPEVWEEFQRNFINSSK